MNKNFIFGIVLFIFSLFVIVIGVVLFNKVPNVENFTQKEAIIMTGAVMSCILGVTGIICSIVSIGTSQLK